MSASRCANCRGLLPPWLEATQDQGTVKCPNCRHVNKLGSQPRNTTRPGAAPASAVDPLAVKVDTNPGRPRLSARPAASKPTPPIGTRPPMTPAPVRTGPAAAMRNPGPASPASTAATRAPAAGSSMKTPAPVSSRAAVAATVVASPSDTLPAAATLIASPSAPAAALRPVDATPPHHAPATAWLDDVTVPSDPVAIGAPGVTDTLPSTDVSLDLDGDRNTPPPVQARTSAPSPSSEVQVDMEGDDEASLAIEASRHRASVRKRLTAGAVGLAAVVVFGAVFALRGGESPPAEPQKSPEPATARAEPTPAPPPTAAPPPAARKEPVAAAPAPPPVPERARPAATGTEAAAAAADPAAVAAPVARSSSPAPSEEDRVRAREAYTRGNTKLFDGAIPEAIAAFKESLKLDPRAPAAHRGLGLAYVQEGNASQAVRHLKRYLKASPSAPDRPLIEKRIEQLSEM